MSKTDYDLSKIKAVAFDVDGVLSPVCVPMNKDGIPRRMANLRDGYAIQLAVRKGIRIAIVSGSNDPAVIGRFKALGVEDIYLISGSKTDIFKQWIKNNGLLPEECAYVGDDIPDYECMLIAGLSVAPRDAADEIKAVARYVTSASGGHGVARELLEQILKVKDLWPTTANANGHGLSCQ